MQKKSQSKSQPLDISSARFGAEADERGVALSKSQLAYRILREKITMMELRPGERLVEQDLMLSLGIGRTPLREAIHRLSVQGLVLVYPRQAPSVAPVQAHEVPQIVEMRTVLEVAAVRLAAKRATKDDIDRLHVANQRYAHAVKAANANAIVRSDSALHQAISAAAHNPHLHQAVAWNRDFGCRLWCMSVALGGALKSREYGHDALIDAIARRKPDAAEIAIRAHIKLMHTRLQILLSGTPEDERMEVA